MNSLPSAERNSNSVNPLAALEPRVCRKRSEHVLPQGGGATNKINHWHSPKDRFGSTVDLRNLSRRQARPSDRTCGSVVPALYDWGRHSGTAFGVGRLIRAAVGLAKGTGALLTNRAGCSANARSSATCRAA